MNFKKTYITEGVYQFEGKDLPEIEYHFEHPTTGISVLSCLFDEDNVAINLDYDRQGVSSTIMPNKDAEAFFLKCLEQLRNGKTE